MSFCPTLQEIDKECNSICFLNKTCIARDISFAIAKMLTTEPYASLVTFFNEVMSCNFVPDPARVQVAEAAFTQVTGLNGTVLWSVINEVYSGTQTILNYNMMMSIVPLGIVTLGTIVLLWISNVITFATVLLLTACLLFILILTVILYRASVSNQVVYRLNNMQQIWTADTGILYLIPKGLIAAATAYVGNEWQCLTTVV